MFSGIVEEAAPVVALRREQGNLHLTLSCSFTSELKIDQSVAHNGVCLTVVGIDGDTYTVTAIQETLDRSSWYYTFVYDSTPDMVREGYTTVEKGSITVNGVSLTVCNSRPGSFQVAIIPYTHEHTNFHQIAEGSVVNLEFDIVGKYISRIMTYGK